MTCNKSQPLMREIDDLWLEISQDMAVDELGNRRRPVWYRSRVNRLPNDLILGRPGQSMEQWIKLNPTPQTNDMTRNFDLDNIGQIRTGDIQILVPRAAIAFHVLEEAEYYMNDDPDFPGPDVATPANFDFLGKSLITGGDGLKVHQSSFWIGYLRKRQA